MKLTAADLLELGVVDKVIPEPEGGAQADPGAEAPQPRPVGRGAPGHGQDRGEGPEHRVGRQPCSPGAARSPQPEDEEHAEGGREDKSLLGGKGANLAEMTRIGIPVPPGFTLTTEVCRYYLRDNRYPEGLTQQVAEAIRRLEDELGKKKILENYLNITFFGEQAYGVEAASQRYFSKHAKDLDLDQAALLAGLVQSPTQYDPIKDEPTALRRRNTVLERMAQLGDISQSEANKAIAKLVSIMKMRPGRPQ